MSNKINPLFKAELLEKLSKLNSEQELKSITNSNFESKLIPKCKKGSKIFIKKENRGTFTKYCDGKVTEECIAKGKRSPNPKIRKKATFAANARKWKH